MRKTPKANIVLTPAKDPPAAPVRNPHVTIYFNDPEELKQLRDLTGAKSLSAFGREAMLSAALKLESMGEEPASVPLLGYIFGGEAQEVRPMAHSTSVAPPFKLPADSYGLVVIGDSMEQNVGPSIPDGSIAFFVPTEFPTWGNIVHAEFRRSDGQDDVTLKVFQPDEPAGMDTFMPLNKRHKPIVREKGDYEIRGVFLRAWDGKTQ